MFTITHSLHYSILQEIAEEQLPTQQLGFRRLLAAIYSHTSAHIIAAPMAHFMAKNLSRFMYSHDTCYVNVHAIESFLKNTPMQMSFRTVDQKQVCFHSLMYYYYRPILLEKCCLYQFFSEMEYIPI